MSIAGAVRTCVSSRVLAFFVTFFAVCMSLAMTDGLVRVLKSGWRADTCTVYVGYNICRHWDSFTLGTTGDRTRRRRLVPGEGEMAIEV